MDTRSLIEAMDERLYPGAGRNWDDALFRKCILRHLAGDEDLLDLGAGAGIVPHMNLRGRARRVAGVDPDPRVVDNPHLDEGRVGTGEALPFDDESFDVVVADNVLEHLDDPGLVFGEVARVLRPGGRFLAKTPNRRHYVPLVAQLTPHAFHQWVNRRRGRDDDDTFPTRYRANTPAAIERLAGASGLEVESVELVEGRPEYMRMTPATYVLGCAYERFVNSSPVFAPLRVLLVASLVKRSGDERRAAPAATPEVAIGG